MNASDEIEDNATGGPPADAAEDEDDNEEDADAAAATDCAIILSVSAQMAWIFAASCSNKGSSDKGIFFARLIRVYAARRREDKTQS